MECVRIDKFLWSVRVFKTRGEAGEACKSGKIFVNGAQAKSSKEIKVTDVIEVRKGAVKFKYQVVGLTDKRVGAPLVQNFVLNITPQSELDKLAAPRETIFMSRDRGAGRPTKRERREIDSLMDGISLSAAEGSSLFFDEDDDDDDE